MKSIKKKVSDDLGRPNLQEPIYGSQIVGFSMAIVFIIIGISMVLFAILIN